MVLPSLNNYAEVGESSLENALSYDTIPKANYDKLNRVQPFLAELQKRSTERLAKDKDFGYLAEDIERYRKALAEKTVSLSEAQRRAERDELKAKSRARKKELLSRHEAQPVTYEISLKQAVEKGLPAPVTNKVPASVTGDGAEVDPVEARTDPDAEELDEPVTAIDIHLKEAERILMDYIRLSTGKNGVAATR